MKKARLILVGFSLGFSLLLGAVGCAVETSSTDRAGGPAGVESAGANETTSPSQSTPLSRRPRNRADVIDKCTGSQPQPWSCGVFDTVAVPGLTTGDPASGGASGTGTATGTGSGTGSDQDEQTSAKAAGATVK